MSETITAPDYRAVSDTDLAEMAADAEGGTFEAITAELARRDRADRMTKARKRLGDIRAEGESAAFAQYLDADAATRGELLSREGKAAYRRGEIADEFALWHMPQERAARYASWELNDYWQDVAPRVTPAAYVREMAAERRAEHAAVRDHRDGGITDERDGTGPGLAGDDAGDVRHGSENGAGIPVRTGQSGPVRGPVQRDGLDETERDDMTITAEDAGNGGSDGTTLAASPQGDSLPLMIPYGTFPLEEARKFAGEILWAPDYMLDALTLGIAASYTLESWNTAPRLLATSPEGLSGKTTLLNVVRLLGLNVWAATNATAYALRSKFNDRERPFVLVDEVSDIFGTSGRSGAHNPVGLVARDCYLRTATVSISNNRTAEDIPAFCFMAMGGRRNAVPADVWTRCIEFKVKRVPESVMLGRDALDPDTEAEAVTLRALLHSYMRAMLAPETRKIQRRFTAPHPKFRDRLRQIWAPLYVTALAADKVERQRYEAEVTRCEQAGLPEPVPPACNWAQRCLTAFKAMALDASDLPVLTAPQAMLRDTAAYIRNVSGAPEFIPAADLRDWLRDGSDEQLWSSLTDRRLAILMVEGLGPNTVRAREDDPATKARGWYAAAVLAKWDALERALTPPVAAEPDEDESSLFDDLPGDDPATVATVPIVTG